MFTGILNIHLHISCYQNSFIRGHNVHLIIFFVFAPFQEQNTLMFAEKRVEDVCSTKMTKTEFSYTQWLTFFTCVCGKTSTSRSVLRGYAFTNGCNMSKWANLFDNMRTSTHMYGTKGNSMSCMFECSRIPKDVMWRNKERTLKKYKYKIEKTTRINTWLNLTCWFNRLSWKIGKVF